MFFFRVTYSIRVARSTNPPGIRFPNKVTNNNMVVPLCEPTSRPYRLVVRSSCCGIDDSQSATTQVRILVRTLYFFSPKITALACVLANYLMIQGAHGSGGS
jgi:hypothetical protein